MADVVARPEIQLTARDATRAAFESVQRSFDGLKTSAAGLSSSFASIGAAITGGAFVAAARSVANYGEELNKATQKTGIATESLSKLRYAADLADVDFGGLQKGLKTLSTQVFEGDKAFTALGISTKDSSGNLRDVEAILGDVADAFAGMEDGAGKSALATRLFGKAGTELIPLLNLGRKGLKDAGDEAERFGLVLSGNTAKAAEEFNDNIKRVGAVLQGLKIQLGNELLPALNDIVVQFVEGTAAAGGLFKAIALFGTINPFKSVAGNIRSLNEELAELEKRRAAFASFGETAPAGLGTDIENTKKRIEFLKLQQRQEALALLPPGFKDETSGRFRVAEVAKSKAPSLPDDDKARKQLTFADLLEKSAMKKLELDDQANAKADELIDKLRQQVDLIDAQIDPYEKVRDNIETLVKALEAGAISQERFDRALQGVYDKAAELDGGKFDWAEKAKEQIDDAAKAGEQFALVMTSALSNAITGGGSARDVFLGLAKDIEQLIIKMLVLEPLAKSLKELFGGDKGVGDAGSNGGINGGGGFLDSVFKGIASIFGGGSTVPSYAVGTSFVPRDGLAMIHRGEAIIPAAQNRAGGGGAVVINNYFTQDQNKDDAAAITAQMLQSMQQIARGTILDERRPGGMLA